MISAGRSSWLCSGTMPPGAIVMWRMRRRRWSSLTFSRARSIDASSVSVTPTGAFGACGSALAIVLSAGHWPAWARPVDASAATIIKWVSLCMRFLRWVNDARKGGVSLRGPAALDGQHGAGDRRGIVGAEKRGQRGHLLDGDEFLGRLRGEQHVADHVFMADAAGARGVGDLLLDERRQHITRADGVDGDAGFSDLERHRLREAGDAMFGRHIGRLVGAGDQRMRRR